jgi:hypothetical protein
MAYGELGQFKKGASAVAVSAGVGKGGIPGALQDAETIRPIEPQTPEIWTKFEPSPW